VWGRLERDDDFNYGLSLDFDIDYTGCKEEGTPSVLGLNFTYRAEKREQSWNDFYLGDDE
jgi:hypothetical protein